MPNKRMLKNKAVELYAQTMLDAAKANDNVLEIIFEMNEALKAYYKYPQLREAFSESTVSPGTRSKVAKDLYKGFDESLVMVFSVMAERKDAILFPRVVEKFTVLAEEELNVTILDVTTVVELDDSLRGLIKEKFAPQFGKDIVLREHINPSILGGIVIDVHGKRVDNSVATKLANVHATLKSREYGGER